MKVKALRVLWIIFLLALLIACGGSESPEVKVTGVASREEVEVERETVAEEAMEEPVEVPEAQEPESVGRDAEASGPVSDFQPQTSQRLIIKDANLDLEVEKTDRAIDGVTQIAGDLGGYIISQQVWYERESKYATLTIAVPVQDFENALRRVRGLASRVLNEAASGEDVTDQYVDLQSRLRNLQLTRDRIRSFLDQAETVNEALEVNRQLSEIEAQIEQVQGRLNYLRDRAAFSTITVNLNPLLPTPTPSPTPTPTPTPTPEAWRPGETVREASSVLTSIAKGLVELLIWVVIVLGPFVIILALLGWIIVKLGQLWRRRSQNEAPPTVTETDTEDRA